MQSVGFFGFGGMEILLRIAKLTLPRDKFERRFRQYCTGFGFRYCGRFWGAIL